MRTTVISLTTQDCANPASWETVYSAKAYNNVEIVTKGRTTLRTSQLGNANHVHWINARIA